jgi:hypothetical protein
MTLYRIYCFPRSADTTPCVSESSSILKYDIYPDARGAAAAVLQNFCLIPLLQTRRYYKFIVTLVYSIAVCWCHRADVAL